MKNNIREMKVKIENASVRQEYTMKEMNVKIENKRYKAENDMTENRNELNCQMKSV
jgi:hypothetical protein